MKTKTIILWIFILVIVDQLIKVFIKLELENIRFEIIPSLLEFRPTFNTKYSWYNSMLNNNFGISIGLIPHIIFYLLIGFLILIYFSHFRNHISNNKKLIDNATIFLIAAILCALISNIMWGNGTLDYIYLKSFFVFDLKDLYVDIGLALFVIYAFKNMDQFEKLILGTNIKDVFNESLNRFKKKITKAST